MVPSLLSHTVALTTAIFLALPQGWCCAAHLVPGPNNAMVAGGSLGEAGDSAEMRSSSSDVRATPPTSKCCHHSPSRVVRQSRGAGSGDDSSPRHDPETIVPTCPAGFPDSGRSDCCCLAASPLLLPIPQAGYFECSWALPAGGFEDRNSIGTFRRDVPADFVSLDSISKHILYCVWRC
jgi:hypothetical protein